MPSFAWSRQVVVAKPDPALPHARRGDVSAFDDSCWVSTLVGDAIEVGAGTILGAEDDSRRRRVSWDRCSKRAARSRPFLPRSRDRCAPRKRAPIRRGP
jgi:phage tail tape-measure protein